MVTDRLQATDSGVSCKFVGSGMNGSPLPSLVLDYSTAPENTSL